MNCMRCNGFLLKEKWPGMGITYTKCVNCGDITDEVILTNRMASQLPAWMVAERLLFDLRGSPAS